MYDIIIVVNRGVCILLFFVMAASIMAVCIIAIHGIAKYLGRELPLPSLVLCSISAMCINFLIISVTPFLTKAYYCILGTMIVFAATGTTCYNKYLLNRKARLAIAALPQAEPKASVQNDAAMHKEATIEPDEAVLDLPSEEPPVKAEPVLEEPTPDTAPAVSEAIPEPVASAEDISADEPAAEPTAKDVVPDAEPEPETETNHLALLEAMETLDDILDFAFAKASTQPQAAIQAYEYALEHYSSDEYAPFIVIDMVNLYQSQEQYQEAIDCISHAMELPVIQENPATVQNFQSYLSQIQALYHSKEPR